MKLKKNLEIYLFFKKQPQTETEPDLFNFKDILNKAKKSGCHLYDKLHLENNVVYVTFNFMDTSLVHDLKNKKDSDFVIQNIFDSISNPKTITSIIETYLHFHLVLFEFKKNTQNSKQPIFLIGASFYSLNIKK